MNPTTLLLYGRSNSGKTTLVGELAEWLLTTKGLKTRLYTADRGGTGPIDPYINLGVIEPIHLGNANPWLFLYNAVRGRVRKPEGGWLDGDMKGIGLIVFEGIRSFAEVLLEDLKALSTEKNINVGGAGNVSFIVTEGGSSLKIGGNNIAHYGVVQSRITEEIWQSQLLPVPYILWTSSVNKDEDPTSTGKILGPDAVGRSLTPELPRWFHYTMRVDVLPAPPNGRERHVLYLGTQQDENAGRVGALGNMRLPKGGEVEKTIIEPASVVEALRILEEGKKAAETKIKQRLEAKLKSVSSS